MARLVPAGHGCCCCAARHFRSAAVLQQLDEGCRWQQLEEGREGGRGCEHHTWGRCFAAKL